MQHAFCICLPTPHFEGSSDPRIWKTEVFCVLFLVVRFKQNAKRKKKCQNVHLYNLDLCYGSLL